MEYVLTPMSSFHGVPKLFALIIIAFTIVFISGTIMQAYFVCQKALEKQHKENMAVLKKKAGSMVPTAKGKSTKNSDKDSTDDKKKSPKEDLKIKHRNEIIEKAIIEASIKTIVIIFGGMMSLAILGFLVDVSG